MKQLVLLQGGIAGMLVGCILLAVLLGRQNTANIAALVYTADCQLPCWNGIQPGETNLEAADAALLRSGYRLIGDLPTERIRGYEREHMAGDCQVRLAYRQGVVTVITLTECDGLRLGDMIRLTGTPQRVARLGNLLTLRNGQVMMALPYDQCQRGLSPYSVPSSIFLMDANRAAIAMAEPSDRPKTVDWIGFVPWWRYRNLYPNMYGC
jgi:hypothetical protein